MYIIKKINRIILIVHTVQIYRLDRLGKILPHNSCKVHDEHVYVYSVDHDDKIPDRTMDNLLIYFQDQCVKMGILCYDKHLKKLIMWYKTLKLII